MEGESLLQNKVEGDTLHQNKVQGESLYQNKVEGEPVMRPSFLDDLGEGTLCVKQR